MDKTLLDMDQPDPNDDTMLRLPVARPTTVDNPAPEVIAGLYQSRKAEPLTAWLVFTADGQLAKAELTEAGATAVCDYIRGYAVALPVIRDSRDAPPIAADVVHRAQAALHLPLNRYAA